VFVFMPNKYTQS